MAKTEMVSDKIESTNKALVLEAFDTLSNKRDYVAAERFWSPNYIQHSAHIAPGHGGVFNLIKSLPPTLKYEPGAIVAEGDIVIVHGRFSGFGAPVNWIAADILRIKNGIPSRALGRYSERSDGGTVDKQAAHVRKDFPNIQMSRRAREEVELSFVCEERRQAEPPMHSRTCWSRQFPTRIRN